MIYIISVLCSSCTSAVTKILFWFITVESPDPLDAEADPCIVIKFSDDATIIRCCELEGSPIVTTDQGGSKLLMYSMCIG